MKLQVMGTGCPKCNKLSELVEQVATEQKLDFTFEKITDLNAIIAAGVMMTPALVADGTVLVSGRIPPESELQNLLKQAAGGK